MIWSGFSEMGSIDQIKLSWKLSVYMDIHKCSCIFIHELCRCLSHLRVYPGMCNEKDNYIIWHLIRIWSGIKIVSCTKCNLVGGSACLEKHDLSNLTLFSWVFWLLPRCLFKNWKDFECLFIVYLTLSGSFRLFSLIVLRELESPTEEVELD